MTRQTNARIAGFCFLFYIAAGITSMMLSPKGEDLAAKFANYATHANAVHISFLLYLSTSFMALALGVTLHALTRDQDPDLAMMALLCRVTEGIMGLGIPSGLCLLWLATNNGPEPLEAGAAQAIGSLLLKLDNWGIKISATFFAVGSTLFCYLFLRGRLIPSPLAWLGLFSSLLLVIALPLQLVELLPRPVAYFIWLPMLIFELIFALWLLIKGAERPAVSV